MRLEYLRVRHRTPAFIDVKFSIQRNYWNKPDDDQIPIDGFSHFSNKEIHVWTAHTNAYDGNWYTLISTCDGQKSSLRSKLKGLWFLVQEKGKCFSSRRSTDCRLVMRNISREK